MHPTVSNSAAAQAQREARRWRGVAAIASFLVVFAIFALDVGGGETLPPPPSRDALRGSDDDASTGPPTGTLMEPPPPLEPREAGSGGARNIGSLLDLDGDGVVDAWAPPASASATAMPSSSAGATVQPPPGPFSRALCERHAVLRLPWDASLDCLCNPVVSGPRPPHCAFLILQMHDKPSFDAGTAEPTYYVASRVAMMTYAMAHGYSYLFVDASNAASNVSVGGIPARATSWLKQVVVAELLPYFNYILNTDSDIVPGDFDRPLTSLSTRLEVHESARILFAGNYKRGWVCAGLWLASGMGERVRTQQFIWEWWTAISSGPLAESHARFRRDQFWEQSLLEVAWHRTWDDPLYWQDPGFFHEGPGPFLLERAGAYVRLDPSEIGTPDSPFLTHFWFAERDRLARIRSATAATVETARGHCMNDACLRDTLGWMRENGGAGYQPTLQWDDLFAERATFADWRGTQ